MVDQINSHRKNIRFNIGNKVFLDNRNIETTKPSTKLAYKKDGSSKTINIVGSAYKLDLPLFIKIHNEFSVELLSKAPTDPLQGQRNPPPPPIETPQGVNYEVDDMLDSRKKKTGGFSIKKIMTKTSIGMTQTTANSITPRISSRIITENTQKSLALTTKPMTRMTIFSSFFSDKYKRPGVDVTIRL